MKKGWIVNQLSEMEWSRISFIMSAGWKFSTGSQAYCDGNSAYFVMFVWICHLWAMFLIFIVLIGIVTSASNISHVLHQVALGKIIKSVDNRQYDLIWLRTICCSEVVMSHYRYHVVDGVPIFY